MTRAYERLLRYAAIDTGSDETSEVTPSSAGQLVLAKKLAEELGVGEITLSDILDELEKPGRDIRDTLPPPVLRDRVLTIEDLTEGMVLTGTVRNVIDFGAFVDIGVKNDGLVHISQLSDKFIKHPMDVVSVGDTVKVKIISIDYDKHRVGLTMKGLN